MRGMTGAYTDVVIDDPANSILLEVYGAELVPTTQFSSKHTLRFPRVHRLRTDKEWYEVDTLQMMEELLRERAGQTAMNDIVGRGGAVSWNRAAKKKRRRGDAATSRNVAPRSTSLVAAGARPHPGTRRAAVAATMPHALALTACKSAPDCCAGPPCSC